MRGVIFTAVVSNLQTTLTLEMYTEDVVTEWPRLIIDHLSYLKKSTK